MLLWKTNAGSLINQTKKRLQQSMEKHSSLVKLEKTAYRAHNTIRRRNKCKTAKEPSLSNACSPYNHKQVIHCSPVHNCSFSILDTIIINNPYKINQIRLKILPSHMISQAIIRMPQGLCQHPTSIRFPSKSEEHFHSFLSCL